MEKHTLIVDDDSIVLFLMEKLVKRLEIGGAHFSYTNPDYALLHLEKNYNEQSLFLIFLDINMPELDGWEFLKELKKFAKPENTWVYIITSSTDKGDIERAGNYKFIRDYLIKPVKWENMLKVRSDLDKV